MKVKELIEMLENYDDDCTVYFENHDCLLERITDIYFEEDEELVILN